MKKKQLVLDFTLQLDAIYTESLYVYCFFLSLSLSLPYFISNCALIFLPQSEYEKPMTVIELLAKV
jgi:hypothetical protein